MIFTMRKLSKSKLIAFRQCPKRLWLELKKPGLIDDSGSQAAFNIGNQVGDIAQRVFDPDGTGINVDPIDIGWDESAAQTEALLQTGKGLITPWAAEASQSRKMSIATSVGVCFVFRNQVIQKRFKASLPCGK